MPLHRNPLHKNLLHKPLRATMFCSLALSVLMLSNFSFKSSAQATRPVEFDVRGAFGVPQGAGRIVPTAGQLKAIDSLKNSAGAPVQVRYNGLTATPRHMFSYERYLTPPSPAGAESVARAFLNRYRDIFRFSDGDLNSLRLKSRATIPDTGTTILLFEQQAGGLPVYHGEVLVNVNRAGQVASVGGESFPQMKLAGAFALTPEQAVSAAANDLGISGFSPQRRGTRQVLATYGNLPPRFVEGVEFGGGSVFTDNIVVTRTIFPMGEVGRPAYKLVLTTPQYSGIMWENIVDAQTGQVLRRISLTSFAGTPGGGQGAGRLSTFRPDVQDQVEALNAAASASGKVFDGMPTALAGSAGFGRSPNPGTPPTYAPETATSATEGRGFKFSQVSARNQAPLVYSAPFGQVLRGFPDATNPSQASPFGWFYLPTDTGGAEITAASAGVATTRGYGYTMSAEARTRNLPENSPEADKSQPFSATLTQLASPVSLKDGRVISRVFQSSYTEGNNVMVADDHLMDDESTHGIKGFSLNRQFGAGYFDFVNAYEYGGVDAVEGTAGGVTYPEGANRDVFPATLTLFYYNNIIHDYLYSVGFTESLWNFQQDNFGKGGAGQDGVSAQVQDGSGTNNANFGTPAEGGRPRMQMFLFTESTFRRSDGDFDFDVVAHEHYHGVSNRSAAKGDTGGLGLALVGECGGQGEGWSDYIAASMADDDAEGEYATGEFDVAIRRLPYTNYRWSYGGINGPVRNRRDRAAPDAGASVPFEVHDIGEVWAATLWDMRELLIMKDPNGVFFDGTRRLGGGTTFFVGNRPVQSVDGNHPIDYRAAFNTNAGNINPAQSIVRPGLVAAEIAQRGDRRGPLATAIATGARLSDTLVLRGLQLCPLNPSFVDSRDSILLADRELTGGENQAIIWRAFASHGVGTGAASTSMDVPTQSAPVVVEDFNVPPGVVECETRGPLAAPSFTARNLAKNTVTITVNDGIPVRDAATYIVSRSASPNGPFVKIAEIPSSDITFRDNNGGAGLNINQTLYYQVRATRNAQCVSAASTRSVAIVVGDAITPAPEFAGVDEVVDSSRCDRLVVNWKPASSENPSANIVYDVYRVNSVPNGDGTAEPSFAPSAANRVATGIGGSSFTDTGLTLGRVHYYIVQARDLSNGKKDTNNTGNTVVKYNAPTSSTGAQVFAHENFENASANNRFAPPLMDSASDPNEAMPAFQRVTNIDSGNGATSMMYAPDFSPSEGTPDPAGTQHGGPSDFSGYVGPLTLTAASMLDYDQFFRTEANFDGGVIEIALGAPNPASGPFPNNATTFDLGNYIVQGGYNGKLDGTLEGTAVLSPLQGRRAFTGTKALHHVRAALGSFAPGGANNPLGLPVFLRFRMSSDSATSAGPNGGWYIDNLAISNLTPAGCGTELVRAADNRPNAGAARFASSTASKAARLLAFARERAGGALPFTARLSRGRARGGSVQA